MRKISLTDSAGKAAWPMETQAIRRNSCPCAEAILLDPNLTGAEKRVIGICPYRHMNPSEQWSCFASIATLAKEAEACEKFQGETLSWVWLDDEPPMDIYSEALTRTNIGANPVWLTFTPLLACPKLRGAFCKSAATPSTSRQ